MRPAIVLLFVIACGPPPSPAPDPTFRFDPACGKAGDTIAVYVANFETSCQGEPEWHIAFGGGERAPTTFESLADECKLTATVPPSAMTGPLRVESGGGRQAYTNDMVFEVPCPAPATDKPYGVVHLDESNGGGKFASALFYPDGDAARDTAVGDWITRSDLIYLRPPISLGTCAHVDPPGPPPSSVPAPFDQGSLILLTPSLSCTVNGGPSPTGFGYASSCSAFNASFRVGFDVTLSSAAFFKHAAQTFGGAGITPSDPILTSPPTTSALAFGAGDQTITFPSFPDSDMTLEIRPAGGTAMTCRIPPGDGMFTIPSAVFGSATVGGYTLRIGEITTTKVGGHELTTVTQNSKSGTYTRP